MWFFKSSVPIADSGILHGMTDCHSHLLPGVDDGVKTEEETWRILDEMERQGVRKVWLTPHIMEDMPNETAALQQKFLRLKQKYQGKVELALAAEYMLDNLFEERLEKDERAFLEDTYVRRLPVPDIMRKWNIKAPAVYQRQRRLRLKLQRMARELMENRDW